MIDVLHCDAECSRERTAVQLKGLAKAYGEYKGTTFDEEKFRQAFKKPEHIVKPHISVLGARIPVSTTVRWARQSRQRNWNLMN